MSEHCDEPTTVSTGHTGTASTADPSGTASVADPSGTLSFGADFAALTVLIDSDGEGVQDGTTGLYILTAD